MRRLVLVVLMCLLPLQWSWSAAASVCTHESGNSHFGHHEHKHKAIADDAHGNAADGQHAAAGWDHPDCQGCNGIGAAFVSDPGTNVATEAGAQPAPEDGRVLPEPPVENLLRPPLSLAA